MKATFKFWLFFSLLLIAAVHLNAQSKIYWLENGTGKVRRANQDGTAIQDLVTNGVSPDAICIANGIGKIYWVEGGSNKIRMANFDGTNSVDLVSSPAGISSLRGITIDETAGKLYFVGANGYGNCNLNGTGVVTYTSTGYGRQIAVNVAANKIYYTDQSFNLKTASLTGTGVTTLFNNLSTSWGVKIDLYAQKLYFSDNAGIYSCNLDGTGRTTIVTFTTAYASMAIDPRNNKLFWMENNTLKSSTLTGTLPQNLITSLTFAFDLAVIGGSSLQAYNINFTNVTGNSLKATWNKGNGTARVAFLKQDTAGSAFPVNGTTYTANTAFGSGTQIGSTGWYTVYNGTDSTVNITGLTGNTKYRLMVCEYGGTGSTSDYNVTVSTLNPNNVITPLGANAPSVSTASPTSITANSATLGGNVTDSGGATISERGIVYATTVNPTTANTKVQIGAGIGSFSQSVTGLTAATTYHVRAYAINSQGTSYGGDSTFSTPSNVSNTTLTGDTTNLNFLKGQQVVVDPTLLITSSLTTIPGATVILQNGKQTGDSLSFLGSLPSGVTANYNATTGVLKFIGNATPAQYQTLLRTVVMKNSTSVPLVTRNVSFNLGTALPYTSNGHFYEYVGVDSIAWTAAKAAAAGRNYFGLQGYLTTITSAGENAFVAQKLQADAWMGASDDYLEINNATGTTTYANQTASEGKWYWVTGPERGQQFSSGAYPSVTAVNGMYVNWNNFQPDNYPSYLGENYAQFYSTTNGTWNDLPNKWNSVQNYVNVMGYVCEYGGMTGDPVVKLAYNRNLIPLILTQDSNITVPGKTPKTIDLTWSKGNGQYRMVMMKENGVGSNVPPVDGTKYIANNTFGNGSQIGTSGWFCVFNDTTGTTTPSLTVNGLKPNTSYCSRVFTYTSLTALVYNNATSNNNPYCTSTAAPLPDSSVTPTTTTPTSIKINWTKGSSTYRLVMMKANGSASSAVPSNGIKYTGNSVFGSGTQIGSTGWFCVFNDTTGSMNPSAFTGLTPGTTYCMRVFGYENLGSPIYDTTISSGNPYCTSTSQSQDSNIVVTPTSPTSLNLTWTKNGTGYRMLMMKENGTGSNVPPTDGTKYVPSTSFGSGSQIGNSGWFCVYNDTTGTQSANVSVTGLKPNTTYCSRVFTYSSLTAPAYNQALATNNPACGNTPNTSQDSTVTFTKSGPSSLGISWSKGTGSFRVVMMKENGSGSDVPPVNGTVYTANSIFGSGSQIGSSGWYCVFNDTTGFLGASSTVTGLKSGSAYCVRVFSYQNLISPVYNFSSSANNPACTNTDVAEVKPFNFITPNDDGLNDTWEIAGSNVLADHEIIVYNIFGAEVFHSTGYTTPWDGKKDGNALPNGEYYYMIKGDKYVLKGAIVLMNK